MDIHIYRLDWTDRGVFGHLITDGFDCITMERMDTLISPGKYKASFYFSPHFKRTVVLIDVPGREYIEIHPADYVNELKGCVALASRRPDIRNTTADAFAADQNVATFNKFMDRLKGSTDLTVIVE